MRVTDGGITISFTFPFKVVSCHSANDNVVELAGTLTLTVAKELHSEKVCEATLVTDVEIATLSRELHS